MHNSHYMQLTSGVIEGVYVSYSVYHFVLHLLLVLTHIYMDNLIYTSIYMTYIDMDD